jgi:integrase
VGLRDGALLALLAAGLSTEELSGLLASNITSDRGHLRVVMRRYGESWSVTLSPVLGGRLLAWLTERRLWGTAEPVIVGPEGPLTLAGIYALLHRYRQEPKAPR